MVLSLAGTSDECLTTMLPQEVAVTVALGGKQQRAVGAFERLLSCVGEDVPPQRAGPWEFAEAVRAGYAVRSQGISTLLFRTL